MQKGKVKYMYIIELDNKCRDYILKKGGIITILMEKSSGGWACLILPAVRLGEPGTDDNYNVFETNGVKIYVVKKLQPAKDRVFIKLRNLFGLKSFDVTGFKLM